MFLGKGQIFGEECLLLNSPSLFTVKCRSAHADIFMINELEFLRRIKPNNITMQLLE